MKYGNLQVKLRQEIIFTRSKHVQNYILSEIDNW